jgi:hypothetical protein
MSLLHQDTVGGIVTRPLDVEAFVVLHAAWCARAFAQGANASGTAAVSSLESLDSTDPHDVRRAAAA